MNLIRSIRHLCPRTILKGAAFLAVAGSSIGHAESPRSRAERRAGQELYWSAGAEPVSLDPTKQVDGSSSVWLGHIYEGLLTYDATGALVPGTAESFVVSADKKTWTFKIRKSAKWHDGRPVTAQDFEYAFRRLADPSYASVYSFIAMTAGIVNAEGVIAKKMPVDSLGVKALDTGTLEVKLSRPTAFFGALMAFQSFFPVRRDLVEKFGHQFALDPASVIGNGPFRLTSWIKDYSLRIERADTYWNAAAIHLKVIESPALVKDAQADFNNFSTGGIDYVSTRASEIVTQAQRAKYRLLPYDTGCVSFLSLNQRPGRPFADIDLRLAVQRGINRREYVDKIVAMPGSRPVLAFVPESMPGSAPSKNFRKEVGLDAAWKDGDVATAKAHLKAALARSGAAKAPPFAILTTDSTRDKKFAEYWQNALAKLMETDVRIESLPLKAMVQRERDLQYDLSLTGWCPDYADAMTFMDFHTSTNDNNFTGWGDARYDALIAQASDEVDPVKRIQLFAEAERLYLAAAPSVPYYVSGGIYLVADGLKGVKKTIFGLGTDFRFAEWVPGTTAH